MGKTTITFIKLFKEITTIFNPQEPGLLELEQIQTFLKSIN